MDVLYVPRLAWSKGTPTSNNGTPRPRLRVPVPTITRHYTGAEPSARARTWPAHDFMPWFQQVALAAGKSYEYNYVIPPRVDGSAQVWEYAGSYQAAHSAGENDVAIGVLFAIGVHNHPSFANYDRTRPTVWEELTDPMVAAYRWLRDRLLYEAGYVLPADVRQIEHRAMPGAATACPGQSVIARAADLLEPTGEEPPPMTYFTLRDAPATLWQTIAPGVAVRLGPDAWAARGYPESEGVMPDEEAQQYEFLFAAPRASVS